LIRIPVTTVKKKTNQVGGRSVPLCVGRIDEPWLNFFCFFFSQTLQMTMMKMRMVSCEIIFSFHLSPQPSPASQPANLDPDDLLSPTFSHLPAGSAAESEEGLDWDEMEKKAEKGEGVFFDEP
jgi:hypothetical protein